MKKQYIGIFFSFLFISQPAMAGHIELLGWAQGEMQEAEWKSKILMPSKEGKNKLSSLAAAVLGGKVVDVSKMFLNKTDDQKSALHSPDIYGVTPLHYAATKGYIEIIPILLINGADINAKDTYGRTPLHWAIAEGHQTVVDILITNDSLLINEVDNMGRSALFWAVRKLRYKIVDALLDVPGIDVNMQDAAGNTPLHYVASTRYVLRGEKMGYRDMPNAPDFSLENAAGAMVEGGLGIAATALVVNYALMVATALTKIQAAQALVGTATITLEAAQLAYDAAMAAQIASGVFQMAPATTAAMTALLNATYALSTAQKALNVTMLSSSFVPGPWTVVIVLLMIAVTVIIEEIDEIKKLADKDQRPEVDRRRNAIIQALIKKSADIDAANDEGKTPLHVAATMKNLGVIKDLIAAKADRNKADAQGNTVMHYAVIGGAEDVVQYLLQNTSLADRANTNGITPLMVALQLGREQIAHALINKGAKLTSSKDGSTLLHYAAAGDKKALIEMVHKKFPQIAIDAQTLETLQTPLHIAAALSNHAAQYLVNQVDVEDAKKSEIKKLKRAYMQEQDAAGFTALHYAARAGKEELVEYLINHIGDNDAKNDYASMKTDVNADAKLSEKTALELAVGAGWPGIAKFLAQYTESMKGKEAKDDRQAMRKDALQAKDDRRSDRRYKEKRSPSASDRMEKWENKAEKKKEIVLDPMIQGAKEGRQNVVEKLAKEGHDVLMQEEGTGRTALMYAVEKGHKNMIDMILDAARKQNVQKQLVDMVDNKGRTAYDLTTNKTIKNQLSKIILQ